jgi:aryl-alcohol dehydrogenase-like predicted oxidoreductase
MTFGGHEAMGQALGALDQKQADALVHRALDAGVNGFDTADAYGAMDHLVRSGKIRYHGASKSGEPRPRKNLHRSRTFVGQPDPGATNTKPPASSRFRGPLGGCGGWIC